MPTPLEWAAMAPWSSVNDLATFADVNRSTVSRQLTDWEKKGLVGVRNDGRLLRPRNRLLVSRSGLSEIFPQQHKHPFEGDYHDHYSLHPEWENHSHPHYYNGYAGAELLWSRLEFMEIVYPFGPHCADGRWRQMDSRRPAAKAPLLALGEAFPARECRGHL